MSRETKFTGIVLTAKPIFEKDKRVDIFTKEQGRKSLILKRGQIKPYPFSGALDPLNVVDIEAYQGKSIAYIKQCSLKQGHPHIRKHFNPLSMGGYLLDIIKKATHPDQENRDLFQLTLSALSALDLLAKEKRYRDLEVFQSKFEKHLLVLEGLADPNSQPTHQQFREHFYHYTGQMITAPTLLSGIMSA